MGHASRRDDGEGEPVSGGQQANLSFCLPHVNSHWYFVSCNTKNGLSNARTKGDDRYSAIQHQVTRLGKKIFFSKYDSKRL